MKKEITITIDTDTHEVQVVPKSTEKPDIDNGYWQPKVGETYYTISNIEGLIESKWSGSTRAEKIRLALGLVFRTPEACDKKRKKIEAKRDIMLWVKEHGYDFEPNWSDMRQKKWLVFYDHDDDDGDFSIDVVCVSQYTEDSIILPTKEAAEHLVREMGETLKVMMNIR